MLKIFDLQKLTIRKIKNVQVVNISFYSQILNLPIEQMIQQIKNELIKWDELVQTARYLYWKIEITGQCDKEDVEDIYEIIESLLTELYCTNIQIEENSERLGLYGIPNVNMKTINLLLVSILRIEFPNTLIIILKHLKRIIFLKIL